MPALYVLDNTLGATFVGLVAASTLHGVSIIQALYYYTHQKDLWPTKLLVAAVMTFDTIHQILISHTVYTYTIRNWGNPADLQLIVWSMVVEVIFNGFTALLVQSFLTMRVWRMSNRNKLLTGVILLLVMGEFGVVVAYTTIASRLKTYAEGTKIKYLSILINALAAAGDVLIAAALCILLHFSRTGFHRSDTMINRLILFAVNTGVITSLCAVGSLITFVVAGNTFLYIAFFFCIGRLYTNSLLATLNARGRIRAAGSVATDVSLSARDFPTTASVALWRPTNISIKIDRTQEFATDEKNFAGGLEKAETDGSSTRLERNDIQSV